MNTETEQTIVPPPLPPERNYGGTTTVVLGIALALSAGFNYVQIGRANTSEVVKACLEGENRLLKDQLNDITFKITSERSYEEGLTDGLVRSKNVGWVDGYHAAMAQVAEQNVMEGKDKGVTSPPSEEPQVEKEDNP